MGRSRVRLEVRDGAKTSDCWIRGQPQAPELKLPQGYFRWNLGPDEALMQLVDYANIACGFHAGDYNTMVRTVRAAIKYGVKMGAHPGLDDVKGFGRRKIDVSPDDIYASTLYQLGALKAIIEAEGGKFSHVKVGHPLLLQTITLTRSSRPPRVDASGFKLL